MRIFLLQSFIQIILLTDTIYSLPVLNFTSSVLTNRMIEALSEALIARDRQKPLKTFQKTRQHNFDYYPSYKQDFADQPHQPYPYYQPSYAEQYQQPLVFQPAQISEQQQQQQQQYPSFFYQQAPEYQYLPTYSAQSPEHHSQPSYAMPVPEPQASFHQVQPPAQQVPTYQNQPQPQEQQQQAQHNFYPQNVFEPQAQHTFYPQNVFDTQTKPQQPVVHVQPAIEQPAAQQPQPQSHIPPPIEVPPQPQPQPHPQPQPQQLHPIAIEPQPQQQQAPNDHPAAGAGFFYPYPYHNVNWYNFQQVWPQVPGGQVDLKSPAVAVAVPTNNAATGDCPTGLCPVGASCSQFAGQWQCACGQNGCSGIQNPCGIFGRYYFPYYPDATRFIQCDQTGVFWIRRCAPGTIFDPKISVCNYPPVVVETGKK